ncbi:acyl-CoA thioesterase [Macrococcus equipercicus]|uniref:Acyl-CoA thioesterase n=1 Tax=Macrococcus equipercicus TaxID=69967 RepID=A0A9Q9BNE3_9STAP|nr:thioesterase family protein [Macrococcus equipercicus]KAA1040290.1 acyl-CoA thioesterase [Macrococcus equipercicus]UTH12766.1 acyl-CoA thioesterase [Macrococcus equipercicus]
MFTTELEIPVRYAETDKMGVVYHANYLIWFEVARTDFIEKAGFSYAEMEEAGVISPVIDAQLTYKNSVTYPEKVTVLTWIESYSKLKTVYAYKVVKEDGSVAATGTTTHILMKRGTNRPIRLDRHFPEWHERYMALYS